MPAAPRPEPEGPPCADCARRGEHSAMRVDPQAPDRCLACPRCGAVLHTRRVAIWTWIWLVGGIIAIVTAERLVCH